MREIRFRIWLGGKFNYWGFMPSPHGMGFLGLPSDSSDLHTMEEMQSKCQQYTGLRDKNGREIYEGDIIKWSEAECVGEVKFNFGGFRFVTAEGEDNENDIDCFLANWTHEMEVIGNIYEDKK